MNHVYIEILLPAGVVEAGVDSSPGAEVDNRRHPGLLHTEAGLPLSR